jgi:hypothetical protein
VKKGQKRIKKKTSHGLTRNFTEGRIDGRIRVSICHGRTRNFTEGRTRNQKGLESSNGPSVCFQAHAPRCMGLLFTMRVI